MYNINRKTDKPDIGYMEAKVSELMKRGIRPADCTKLLNYFKNLREELKKDFQEKYNIENPNSNAQLVSYLEHLSSTVSLSSKNDIINICYDDTTHKWTTNKNAISKLAALGYEFAQDLLDYRYAKKYAESVESFTAAISPADGLVHPTVTLAKTHRINYSKPGIMSIPKKLLWHMIAPFNNENVLYSVDIKNQEPSLLISMTGAEELRFALENEDGLYETMFKQCFVQTTTANILVDTLPENRVYTIPELKKIGTISPASYSSIRPTTKNVFYKGKRVIGIETVCIGSEKGLAPQLPDTVDIECEDGTFEKVSVTWESFAKKYKRGNDYSLVGTLKDIDIQISKVERKEFKTAWLALSYGASIFGIKMMCKTIDGSAVYKYVTGIEAIKKYRSMIDKIAREGITSIRTAFGTPMYAGEFDDWKRAKRVLLDLPIQGTAADVLSLLIKRFYDYTQKQNLTDKLYLYYTRHDELIIEVNGEWLKEVGNDKVESILRDMLEHQIDDWAPFKIEISQVKPDELNIEIDDDEED